VPYFKWQGIDLRGNIRSGKMFARSAKHLDTILFKRDIALISSRSTFPLISLPVNLSLKISFFRRLALLLDAGVLLPQAVLVLSESMEHSRFQEIINNIEKKIRAGAALHLALLEYHALFDSVMIHMINAGQEAGALPPSLKILATHLETKQDFYKKIRAAALVPLLTFLFFISIALVIFIVIIPLFSTIFESIQQELPQLTKGFLRVSDFLRSSKAFFIGIGFVLLLSVGYLILGKERRKKIIDQISIHTPGISRTVIFSSIFSFFQSVATLLEGGMQLVPALHIAKEAISNQTLKTQLDELEKAVVSGSSLGQSLAQHPGPFARPDIEAIIAVGEESGNLAGILSKIAADYQERLESLLSFYSMLLQPFLMIVLGVFIALLIVAVYLPILSLSYVIS
jgi:type IV pilus assembly protein PilC